jgi:hypothetical protein
MVLTPVILYRRSNADWAQSMARAVYECTYCTIFGGMYVPNERLTQRGERPREEVLGEY